MTVVFDFDGSLALARSLWSVADELDGVRATREASAAEALVGWQGVYGDQFVTRVDHEQVSARVVAEQLRGEANGWAEEWRKAIDQVNRDRYAAAVRSVEADRGFWDDVGGFFFGHNDLPSEPSPAATPTPPGFAATRGFANY